MKDGLHPTWWNAKGVLAAGLILSGWAALLVVLLSADLRSFTWWILPAMALQTFLYTGLFITAHDAMHRTLAPDYPLINRGFGVAATALYALFSFKKLQEAHRRHHDHPASEKDPDFHDEGKDSTLSWYLRFMRTYLSPWQLLGMAAVFNLLHLLAGVALPNLILFWVVPALASTWQLFYFGTVLPHRRPPQGYADEHRARSNDYSPILSFLTCYHFGYHWEHHQRPDLPWWRLPTYRREVLESSPPGRKIP